MERSRAAKSATAKYWPLVFGVVFGAFYLLGVPQSVQAEDATEGRAAIFVNPPEATIYVDGSRLGEGKFVGRLPLGSHIVRFEREGFNTVQERLDLKKGDGPTYLVIHLRNSDQPDAVGGRSGGWVDTFDEEIAAWSLTGAGTLFLVGGSVLLSLDGDSACEGGPKGCASRFETSAVGGLFVGLGSAALTSGVILFLWDELAGSTPRPSSSHAELERAWGVSWGSSALAGNPSAESTTFWLRGNF